MIDGELIVRREGRLGRLTLNRPEALGALTTGMCASMIEALQTWRDDDGVAAVLIDHAGERGFCAGGDIRTLADSATGDGRAALEFFRVEYRLDALIGGYPKPVITVMDGAVMGGGVGISLPARFRIATERTRFAMPETGIGLFPDVGAGWFLPRLPDRVGLWLVLTGARLGPADCVAMGLATEMVPAAELPGLKAALADAVDIGATLARFAADPGPPPLAAHRAEIAPLFSGDSVEAVAAALAADGGDWARAQLAAMAPKSPLSAKVAFRLIAGGLEPKSLAADLAVEYRLAARLVLRPDFREGVRATIVDKTGDAAWRPATLAATSADLLDTMFAPLPPGEEWTPLLD